MQMFLSERAKSNNDSFLVVNSNITGVPIIIFKISKVP